ncbi:MAG TPA: 16S rRNA (guanine(966)-N(2))-methyltransferase RsmD [Ignavibacteriaceae bacterium]|nr:16S rRNA (guanine(966)-N(2))-methyltransferase RsmD [Ignavibacteriaceae bacterium]
MRMRIISGEYKGRLINVPDSDLIRPTTDRVRETLFNLLNNIIDFEDIKVLDIYAGSGSLGLECLSRGAKEIHFVEKNFVIYKNLEENIKSLDVSEQCKIFKMEAKRFANLYKDAGYNLILLDPPFFKYDVYDVVNSLLENNYLAEDGMIILERSVQTREKDIENFKLEPFKVIGDTCLYRIEKRS